MTQIYVLDAGGQYCHLIARKVRELGVYSEIRDLGTPAAKLEGAKGIIISGGPSSVTASGSPHVDPEVYGLGVPILGICYGHQLVARDLGGRVASGVWKEYGRAMLEVEHPNLLFEGTPRVQRVWMSHGDTVLDLPDGFIGMAATGDCKFAAACDPARQIYGVQFHPEVAHTEFGKDILANFVKRVCGAARDWDPARNLERLCTSVRARAAGQSVFFLVSGGVDSTVAFVLTVSALGQERVRGLYVDTGFMRKGETQEVRAAFAKLAIGEDVLKVVDRSDRFFRALEGVWEPEMKRKTIGRLFVDVQSEEFAAMGGGRADWLLGQGTIYPDTIESGGTALAAKIKTHHNRVDEIGALMAAGRVLEPLVDLYKDEVRAVGHQLGLPESVIGKHPFPGPGLAIRCLCAREERAVSAGGEEIAALCRGRGLTPWIVPVRTVGVQGDERTYSKLVVLSGGTRLTDASAVGREITNRMRTVNRVAAVLHSAVPMDALRLREDYLRRERLDLLREVDAAAMEIVRKHGWYERIWQFPVGLLPLDRSGGRGETVLLRPVNSRDGMTADHVELNEQVIAELVVRLSGINGVSAILYDVTDKPPATIELE